MILVKAMLKLSLQKAGRDYCLMLMFLSKELANWYVFFFVGGRQLCYLQ